MLLEFNKDKPGPKTHVFLIGVGGYPFLKNGVSPKQQQGDLENLGQLTSPIISVTAMYNKIIEYDTNSEWCKPLGSIEMLVSTPPGVNLPIAGLNPENASIDNIRNTYQDWKIRCDEHEDNVALFYYCGHGFEKDHHYLLADDFGEKPLTPWLGAFNFDHTRNAFYGCKAKTQIWFVDACREVNFDMISKTLSIPPLDDPSLYNPEEKINHLTLKSTAAGQSAYSKKNEVAYFTQAVISGMDGMLAMQDENNHWVVDTGEFASKINRIMDQLNPDWKARQNFQVTIGVPAGILKKTNAPNGWFEIFCGPDEALEHANLSCEEEDNAANKYTRAPKKEIWRINVKAATYKIAANFDPGSIYKNNWAKRPLIPPVIKIKIPCT